MEEITLKLTISETNSILGALGSLPYIQVMELIAKIQAQAKEQLAVTGDSAVN